MTIPGEFRAVLAGGLSTSKWNRSENGELTGTISPSPIRWKRALQKPYVFNKLQSTYLRRGHACPPEPPLRFAMVSYYLLWGYRSSWGATAAGAEALHAVATKER